MTNIGIGAAVVSAEEEVFGLVGGIADFEGIIETLVRPLRQKEVVDV
jgi:hypothetical protein